LHRGLAVGLEESTKEELFLTLNLSQPDPTTHLVTVVLASALFAVYYTFIQVAHKQISLAS